MLNLRVIQQIENKAIIFLFVFCSFPSFSINYFHSDAHGTVLEKIIGYSTGVNEFVLAIDSENESLEQGLLERRVLLRWDVVDKEWHRIKIGQQIIEREFKEDVLRFERIISPEGKVQEENEFDYLNNQIQRKLFYYNKDLLTQLDVYDSTGLQVKKALYFYTPAGRLRKHFVRNYTNSLQPTEEWTNQETAFVFQKGRLIEERQLNGPQERILRYNGEGILYSEEEWFKGNKTLQRFYIIENNTNISGQILIDYLENVIEEIIYDNRGRQSTITVSVLSDVEISLFKSLPLSWKIGNYNSQNIIEEKSYSYNDDNTVSSFQIISNAGLEVWEYDYNEEGRLDKESYQRRGTLVRVSFFPNERKRVDELYRADEIFLRVTWFDDVKVREEVIKNGKIIKVREFSDGVISGTIKNDGSG